MGNTSDPITLHKYMYANADPVATIDPSGNVTLREVATSIGISTILNTGINLYRGDSLVDAVAAGVVTGTIEGILGIGVLKALGVVGPRLARFSSSLRASWMMRSTFSAVRNLGARLPGFRHLGYQMEIETRAGKFLFSSGADDTLTGGFSGALKHMVGEVKAKAGAAISTEFAEFMVIKELQAIAEKSTIGLLNRRTVNGIPRDYLAVRTEGYLYQLNPIETSANGVRKIYHILIEREFL